MADFDWTVTVPENLSYSQVSKYAECGERYRLEYARQFKGASWYASVAGTVIHKQTEIADRRRLGDESEEIPDFKTEFLRQVRKEQDRGVRLQASGKVLLERGWSGGPNKKDVDWWLHYGPQFLPAWQRWRDQSSWQIATVLAPNADGTMVPTWAIELPFSMEIGGREVIGYIDRVFWDPATGEHIVLDIKSGSLPDGKLQLGDYGVALSQVYGVIARTGAYWQASPGRGRTRTVPLLDDDGNPVLYKTGERKGQPRTREVAEEGQLEPRLSAPVDLTMWDWEYVNARYEMARDGIMAGVFLPNVTRLCKGCGVRKYCRAVGGDRSYMVPARELFIGLRKRRGQEVVEFEEDLTED